MISSSNEKLSHDSMAHESLDDVVDRIADPEVRALVVDLIHAIEASESNQLARQPSARQRDS